MIKFLDDFLIRKCLLDYSEFIIPLSEATSTDLIELYDNPLIKESLLFLNSDFINNFNPRSESSRVTYLNYIFRLFTNPVPLNIVSGIQYFGEFSDSKNFEFHIFNNKIIEGQMKENPSLFFYNGKKYYYEIKENIITNNIKYISESVAETPKIRPSVINQDIYLEKIENNTLKYQYFKNKSVNSFFPDENADVSSILNKDLLKNIDSSILISKNYNSFQNDNYLTNIKNFFLNKFNERDLIPFKTVFHPLFGVGNDFFNIKSNNSLINALSTNYETDLIINKNELNLYRQIKDNKSNLEFQINDFDYSLNELPLTFSVLLNIINNRKCSLQSVSGLSAKNIFNRFTTKSSLKKLANKIINIENKSINFKYVDLLYICDPEHLHLFTSTVFRNQNIEFFSEQSGFSNNLKLDDLLISVNNNILYIYDKNDMKVLLPVVPNQYNLVLSNIQLLYFFKSYSSQFFMTDFDFCLNKLSFFLDECPRICHKNVVLYPRSFILKKYKNFEIEFERLSIWSKYNSNNLIRIKTNEHLEGSIISLNLIETKSILIKYLRKCDILFISEVIFDKNFNSNYLSSAFNQLILFGVNND